MKDPKPDVLNDENTPPEQLSAWARWQLPSMGAEVPPKANAYNLRNPRKPAPGQSPEHESEPEIKPPTLEEIEAIRAAAFEEGRGEGFAAGKTDGYKDGYKKGEADVRAAVTRIGQIARVLLDPIPNNDNDLEAAVLQLVENICKRVIQRELKLDSSGLRQVVTTALDSLNPGAQRIRIHLNPDDCELITHHLHALGELEGHWRVLPHATIIPGGCIIETDNSLIDARAEKRLAAVIHQVFERQQQALESNTSHQRGMDQLLDEVSAFPIDDVIEEDPETLNPDGDSELNES